jgi:hypothetical protein
MASDKNRFVWDEEKRKRIEENCEKVRQELVDKGSRFTESPRSNHAEISHAKKALDQDPIGLKTGRRKLAQDTSVKKELAFNSYIQQLEEPRSFINLLPESMKKSVVSIPEDMVNQDEDTLLRTLEERYNYKPTASVEALRTNFWMEHDRVATTRNEVMNQTNVYLGVISREHFHNLCSSGTHVLAYILCRPPEYEAVMKGLLNLSTRRIRDVLNIPLQKADGSIQDAKIIELVLKAAAMVDLRAKGGYVQRSETKNLTMMKQETTSYTTVFNAASSTKTTDLASIAANIDEKIAALEKEMAAVPGISHQSSGPPVQDVIEVTATRKDELV